MAHIYKIENKINGMVYIGSSQDANERFKQHLILLKKGQHKISKFQDDFNRHGQDNFIFYIIEEADYDNIRDIEYHYIKMHNRDMLYNISIGNTRKTEIAKKKILQNAIICHKSKKTYKYRKITYKSTKIHEHRCKRCGKIFFKKANIQTFCSKLCSAVYRFYNDIVK